MMRKTIDGYVCVVRPTPNRSLLERWMAHERDLNANLIKLSFTGLTEYFSSVGDHSFNDIC